MAINLKSLQHGQENKPPRIIIYGENGIGKTTFAAQAPSPVLIQTEDGLGQLDIPRFPLATTYQDVIDSLDSLEKEKHDFSTVIIDSLDWLEKLIFQKVAEDEGKEVIEEIAYGKGYVFALGLWDNVANKLNWLRNNKQMLVILVGHSLIKTFNSPDTESYDRYRLDLHDKSASFIRDWADCILFAKYKVFTKTSADQRTTKATNSAQNLRFLYTEERPTHWAKNRYSLPYELPFEKQTSWATFAAAMWPKK